MCRLTRRAVTLGTAAALLRSGVAGASDHGTFVAAAFRMKAEAVAAGDQPYGAVVVMGGRIVGYGPSRVVLRRDPDAHAEREAIRAARAAVGDLSGALLYSSSRPCALCERAAAEAGIARMYFGATAADAGPPR